MRWISSLFCFAFVLAFAFTSREARAQTSTPSISGIEGAVLRCEPPVTGACNNADNAGENIHPSGIVDSVVNFEDCEANLYYQFELGISYPSSSYNLQAWVGTEDCSMLANRQTEATSLCWPVAPFEASLVNPYLLNVRVRDIVSGAFTTTHQVTYAPTGFANSDDAVCQTQAETGSTALVLYMFFADAEGNPVGTVQQYPITLDMRAGNVQGNISVGIGDTVLIVNIPTTTDPDTQGYYVFCDPPPGSESATETVPVDAPTNNGLCPADTSVTPTDALDDVVTDASEDTNVDSAGVAIVDDAGGNACGVSLSDSGIPSPGGCSTSSVLVPGNGTDIVATVNEAGETVFVEGGTSSTIIEGEGGVAATGTMVMGFQFDQPFQSKYQCGYGSASSTTINVTGANGHALLDNHYYNIAVAVVDGNGNVGPLSNVECAEPVAVADFWYEYYQAGGRAGGFCSTDGAGLPAGTGGLGVLMAASIVATIRRRRRG